VDISQMSFEPVTPFAPDDGDVGPERPLEHRPLAGPSSLTLAQYAAVESELAIDPSRVTAVLQRYGLTDDTRRAHARALRDLFDREPAARQVWTQVSDAYAAWRSKGGQT